MTATISHLPILDLPVCHRGKTGLTLTVLDAGIGSGPEEGRGWVKTVIGVFAAPEIMSRWIKAMAVLKRYGPVFPAQYELGIEAESGRFFAELL